MPTLYQLGQLAYALFVMLVIAERVRALYFGAATSDATVTWIVRSLEKGETALPLAWAMRRPEAHVARVLAAAPSAGGEGEVGECLIDLQAEAIARLRLIRVCATLASTLGLLGGILVLARGQGANAGLAALKAGAAERSALDEAIATMAIGVATSAICFQALALLRPAAQKLLLQAKQIARSLPQDRGAP